MEKLNSQELLIMWEALRNGVYYYEADSGKIIYLPRQTLSAEAGGILSKYGLLSYADYAKTWAITESEFVAY